MKSLTPRFEILEPRSLMSGGTIAAGNPMIISNRPTPMTALLAPGEIVVPNPLHTPPIPTGPPLVDPPTK